MGTREKNAILSLYFTMFSIDLLAIEKDHGKSGQDLRVTIKLL